MSTANARKAQRIESFIVTIERLCKYIRDEADYDLKSTMNTGKVNDAIAALDNLEEKAAIFHTKIAEASATSSDTDVLYRSGSGGGK